mmetsp:Transcript_41944/g.97116  ORF Transcript_41944/g.97116 Transcript_41944/m.97116 type:complete len:92 (-) Transcript_41944:205-480(-)
MATERGSRVDGNAVAGVCSKTQEPEQSSQSGGVAWAPSQSKAKAGGKQRGVKEARLEALRLQLEELALRRAELDAAEVKVRAELAQLEVTT